MPSAEEGKSASGKVATSTQDSAAGKEGQKEVLKLFDRAIAKVSK